MPPKKLTSKKAPTKASAPSADAEVFNNGEKEVVEELPTDAKSLANGTTFNDTEDAKESTKSKVTKRVSGRVKNVAPELEVEAPPSKKPAAKGRGKRKSTENEVKENETVSTQPEIQEVEAEENEEIKTKVKGRGGGKKAEPKTKKAIKAKENKKEVISNKSVQEEESNKGDEAKVPEKNTKATSGRKKKQDVAKTEESVDVIQEYKEDEEEKSPSKKLTKNTMRSEETVAEIEPKKKKGRTAKKEKPVEKDEVMLKVAEIYESKADVKDKKPTKRGRTAAKIAVALEETPATNGDTEEVLPKKRARNAPSIDKEIVKEKPKKGRAKRTDKVKEELSEKDIELQGKEEDENATNGEVKQEKTEDIEEHHSLNKKEEKQSESVEPAPIAEAATRKAKGGRKRAAPSTNKKKTSKATADDAEELDDGVVNTELEDEADGSKPSKTKKSKTDSAPLNATTTVYNKADFDLPPPGDGQTVDEPRFNLKISSWNVAGLRSWVKKEGLKFLDYEQPDIFCMQETKCTNDQLPEEVVPIPGYHPYWLCMPGGYAGVAIYSKIMPINVEYGIGNKEFDDCGRIITAEYEKFYLINVYVPNSGRKLVNLEARMKWEKLFQEFVQNLDARKPVVMCGDMNVSHKEHDLANPKSNTRNAGFTKEERDKLTELLSLGYIDTFRHLYPERKGAYTYWTYMGNARSRNVGWRLDYFIVSDRFIKRVVDNCIRSQCMGSDHCPITLFLKL